MEVVSADTSFSDPDADDNRGIAVTAVLITGSPEQNRLELSGVLRDGTIHRGVFTSVGGVSASAHPFNEEDVFDEAGDRLLGTADAEGWWYKTRLVSDARGGVIYRQTRGKGRVWETRDVPSSHV